MAKVETLELLDRLIQGGLTLLLAVSVLAFGGVSGWGLAGAVLLAACLLVVWACRMAAEGEIRWQSTPLDGAVLAALILLIVQMALGFPWGWQTGISPDRMMAGAMQRPGWLPFFPGSLDYHATRDALVLFLVYAGVFYLVVNSVKTRPQMNRLLTSLSVLGAVVAFYGLVEFLSGNHGILGWKEYAPPRVRGTLVNPDHFAAYLGMVIPVVTALLIGSGASRRRRVHPRSAADRSSVPDETPTRESEDSRTSLFDRHRSARPWERESRQLLLSLGCALMIVALVFTFSRAGITSFLVGGLFFVALLWIREPGHRRRLAVMGIALAAAALIAWIGAEPVLERFSALETDSSTRGRLYRDALAMARDFPVLGTGLGTFERVFPRYASPEFTYRVHVSHAHSEPLQLAAEGGLVALAVLIFGLVALFRDLLFRRLLGLVPFPISNCGFRISNLFGRPPSAVSGPPSALPTNPQSPVSHSQFAIRNSKSPEVRHDPYNISIAFGCLSSLVVIFVHSLFDFPLRIPANGILLATVLGIAVVAVGVRFRSDGAESLLPSRVLGLSRRGRLALVLGAAALGIFMAWTTMTGALAEELGDRGYEIIAGKPASDERVDRPWVIDTARNREALADLSLAVRLDPMSAEGQYRLGRLYEQLALRTWNAGLSEEGKFIADLPGRARTALGILDEAMRRYAAAVRLAPPYAEAWGRLGWAYGIRSRIAPDDPAASGRASDDTRLALAGLHQAIAMNPNNRYRHEVLAAFGFARLDRDRPIARSGLLPNDPIFLEAIQAQQRAVELDPVYLPDALGRTLRSTQDIAALVATVPAQAPDALYAARLLDDEELWPQAKAFFRRAIELAPDDGKPLYYREYAEALTRREEIAEAGDVLRIVLRFDPQNLDLQLALAGSLHRLEREAEALEVYQEAMDLARRLDREGRPSMTLPLRASRRPGTQPQGRAWPSREERVLDLIQQRFPAPKRTADPMTKVLGALAAFYHDQHRDDLAVPLWEKAMDRTPDDAPTAYGLARSYDAVGAWISAIDAYKRAIELDQGSLEYRLTLADRYYENDMTFQAINLWRDVLVVRPTLVQTRLKLAVAYTRLEQYPDALREYERVLQLQPENGVARASLQRLRGRPSGA